MDNTTVLQGLNAFLGCNTDFTLFHSPHLSVERIELYCFLVFWSLPKWSESSCYHCTVATFLMSKLFYYHHLALFSPVCWLSVSQHLHTSAVSLCQRPSMIVELRDESRYTHFDNNSDTVASTKRAAASNHVFLICINN